MKSIIISVEYEIDFELLSEGKELEKEFLRLKKFIENDTEKFILMNLDKAKKNIMFELKESS